MTTTSVKPSTSKPANVLSDEMLIDMALDGSQLAYSLIVERHERMLRAVITRYLKEEEDIQEALQDTFVRMYRALPGFRRECKLSSWLCRIAISTAPTTSASTTPTSAAASAAADAYYHPSSSNGCVPLSPQ